MRVFLLMRPHKAFMQCCPLTKAAAAVRRIGAISIRTIRAKPGSYLEFEPPAHVAYDTTEQESQAGNIPLISQACMRLHGLAALGWVS
jgi:hypothetical protein